MQAHAEELGHRPRPVPRHTDRKPRTHRALPPAWSPQPRPSPEESPPGVRADSQAHDGGAAARAHKGSGLGRTKPSPALPRSPAPGPAPLRVTLGASLLSQPQFPPPRYGRSAVAAARRRDRDPRRGISLPLPTPSRAPAAARTAGRAGEWTRGPGEARGASGRSAVGRAKAAPWAAAPRPLQAAKPPELRICPALACRSLRAKPGPTWRW